MGRPKHGVFQGSRVELGTWVMLGGSPDLSPCCAKGCTTHFPTCHGKSYSIMYGNRRGEVESSLQHAREEKVKIKKNIIYNISHRCLFQVQAEHAEPSSDSPVFQPHNGKEGTMSCWPGPTWLPRLCPHNSSPTSFSARPKIKSTTTTFGTLAKCF